MRTWLITTAVLLAGTAIGIASSVWDYAYTRDLGFSRAASPSARAATAVPAVGGALGAARLEVPGGTDFDFGVMERDQEGQHSFVVKNVGSAPLSLIYRDKSCQCTSVNVSRDWIPPGESGEVQLTWRPDKYDLDYRQAALFETNDPGWQELRLSIVGRVQQIARCTPRQLSLGNIRHGESAEARVDVFGYRDDDLELQRVTFLHPDTSDSFAYQVEPMTPDQLAAERGAKRGYVVTVQLKPGLPVGSVQQQLRIVTNKTDIPPMEVPIHATIVGEVSIYGAGYQRDRNLLYIGPVPSAQGVKRVLNVFVRSTGDTEPQLTVAETDPADVLKASVGPAKRATGLTQFPLIVTLQPSGHAVNRLGNEQGELARIRLETNLSETKEITILVSFAL